jgi:hypothetical protein
MNECSTVEARVRAAALLKRVAAYLFQIPVAAKMVLGLFLLAAMVIAGHRVLAPKDSSLRLKVQHNLRGAQLSVWVDGDLAYSERLVGSAKKKFGLIPEVSGSLSEALAVSSGSHQVRVRVASDDGLAQENITTGNFARNAQRTLAVTARRDDLSLNWPGTEAAAPEAGKSAPVPSSGGLSRYADWLVLTVAGSIISALTGYAIKELPRQFSSRQSEAPKA